MRRVGLAALFVSSAVFLARCLFPSLDGLSGADASIPETGSEAAIPDTGVETGATIQLVQGSATAPFPPATVTLSAAIGAGDTIVVCSAFPVDFGSLQVTETLNRTYTLLGTQDGTGKLSTWHQVCFVSIGGPGGNDVVSLATTSSTLADGAPHSLEAYVFEYQGVSAIDSKLTTAGTLEAGVDASWDAGSIAASAGSELLFAWVEAADTAHLDPSFTSLTTFHANNVGDEIVPSPGSYAITGSANDNWALIAATFKGF